jgi:hypothetical protein
VEANFACGFWFRIGSGLIFGDSNPAYSFTGFNFAGQESTTLFRDPTTTGEFNLTALEDLINVLDDSVPDQTVPTFSSSADVDTFPLALSIHTSIVLSFLVTVFFF